jgi:hypothetical protein
LKRDRFLREKRHRRDKRNYSQYNPGQERSRFHENTSLPDYDVWPVSGVDIFLKADYFFSSCGSGRIRGAGLVCLAGASFAGFSA